MVRGGSGPCADQCTTQLWEPCRWLQRWPRMTEASYFLSHSQHHHSHSRLPWPSVAIPPVLSLLGLLQTALELWSLFIPHAEVGLHLLCRSHNTTASSSLRSSPHTAFDGQPQCSFTWLWTIKASLAQNREEVISSGASCYDFLPTN